MDMIEHLDLLEVSAEEGGALIPTPIGEQGVQVCFSLLCYDSASFRREESEVGYLVSEE